MSLAVSHGSRFHTETYMYGAVLLSMVFEQRTSSGPPPGLPVSVGGSNYVLVPKDAMSDYTALMERYWTGLSALAWLTTGVRTNDLISRTQSSTGWRNYLVNRYSPFRSKVDQVKLGQLHKLTKRVSKDYDRAYEQQGSCQPFIWLAQKSRFLVQQVIPQLAQSSSRQTSILPKPGVRTTPTRQQDPEDTPELHEV
ncbi:hypothetical protein GQ600_26876 [Phytophthora cactorum]|nr:hypothetical protein GQ600_26876 [Phytophthora cactorum]